MHGRTPWERCLGGSESALVFHARALAARGHHVDVFTRCDKPGIYDDVTYHDIDTLDAQAGVRDWDVFVSLRFPDLVMKDVRASLRVLWCQDVLRGVPVHDWLAWCDLIVFVSEWHRQDTVRSMPAVAPFTAVIPNPVDLTMVPPSRAEQGPLCVHVSRPERGLRALLRAWPSIHARVPGSRLLVARYRSFHEPRGSEIERFCQDMDTAVEQTAGAEHIGHLTKPELYELFSRAALMVYPAEFDETSCIAAIESQACGLPVVAVRRGALPETLHPDACSLVDPGSDMVEQFSDRVVELLWDDAARHRLSDAGRRHSASFDANRTAELWEAAFVERLSTRRGASGGLASRAGAAVFPGVSRGLRAGVASRLGQAQRVGVAGGEWDGCVPVAPGANGSFDAILDLGLPNAADRPTYLRWLKSLTAGPVVHLLRYQDVTYHDIVRWFGESADIATTLEAAHPWGTPARYWIIRWLEAPCLPDIPERRAWNRPTPTVSACLIVRDADDTLATTLQSLTSICDEIRVVDTGSVDHTMDVVDDFRRRSGVPVHLRQIPWPNDFAEARNRSVEDAEGDWILWIDADERLIGGERLRRLLQTPLFEAYAIRQHNHIFDHSVTQVEIPFRVYRNGRGYRFFGAVHEHPERALNEVIEPWTVAPGVEILHYGYLTEATRTRKLLARNLALLNQDFVKYPGRRLTDILYLRDCVNLARFDLRAGGPLRPDHRLGLSQAASRFEAVCLPARDRYYWLGRDYYDQALGLLGEGFEISVQVGTAEAAKKTHRWRQPDDAIWLATDAARRHVVTQIGGPR